MLNVDALKQVYAALGGDADDVAGISQNDEMISAIATVIPTAHSPLSFLRSPRQITARSLRSLTASGASALTQPEEQTTTTPDTLTV